MDRLAGPMRLNASLHHHSCSPNLRRPFTIPGFTTPNRCLESPSSLPIIAASSSVSEAAEEEDLSSEYTDVMQERMGSGSLFYRHEDGMNYNRILDDLIVGSCLQQEGDVDILAEKEDVRTVLCLQEDSDMAYFSLDITPIQARCQARSDIKHLRHAIRDFDPYSLRRRLPAAVVLLNRNATAAGGTSYVHCTAGLGRAPATALAYMWWIKEIPLDEAYELLTGIRPCKPKADAIRAAAVDLLYGNELVPLTLCLRRAGTAEKVEVAGLDVGWGQSVELHRDPITRNFQVQRQLPPGTYQFKFILDGYWGPSMDHMTMIDGDNLNNFILVPDVDMGPEVAAARARIRAPGGLLTDAEFEVIRKALSKIEVDGNSTSAPTAL